MRVQEEDEYEWLNESPTSTQEMNAIVMDYLATGTFTHWRLSHRENIAEGFWEVADCFAEETGLPRPTHNATRKLTLQRTKMTPFCLKLAHSDARQEIRASILAGNIDEACHQINDIEPALLDDELLLHYRLMVRDSLHGIETNARNVLAATEAHRFDTRQ